MLTHRHTNHIGAVERVQKLHMINVVLIHRRMNYINAVKCDQWSSHPFVYEIHKCSLTWALGFSSITAWITLGQFNVSFGVVAHHRMNYIIAVKHGQWSSHSSSYESH